MTEEQRKENSKFFINYMSVIGGIIASYVFGYIGSVMEAEDLQAQKAIVHIIDSFKDFSIGVIFPPEINVTFLMGVALGIGAGFIIKFFLHNDYERNYSYKANEVAGTGGFMNSKDLEEYNKKYISPEPENKDEPSPNMIMSNSFRRPIEARKLIGNNNVLVVGGAGTGKSRFFIKPNILQMNASFVVTDPSGEIINALGKTLTDHGYKIKIFNISDMAHSNCYNPLNYIRDEAGVSMLIDCFIRNTTGKNDKGDQFFTNAERLLYSACVFYLTEFCNDESKKNFPSVFNMVNASSVDENNPMAKSPLDELFEPLPQDSLAWKYYKAFKQAAGKTLKSIIISCVTRLQPFMTPQVVNLTKRDELDLANIGDEKTALFIITPQADRTYAFLASMLYSQLFETLYHKGEQQLAAGGSERMKVPVRCLMDEFANIGEVPEFPSKLSTMRKYNISATIVLQDIAQIESMYKDDWKTLVGNCSSIVFLGTQEPNTLKYFSDMLGKMTVTSSSRGVSKGGKSGSNKNFQQTSREVMQADELGRMDSSLSIVFTQNHRPVQDKKYQYENHPHYEETGDYNEENNYQYNKMALFNTNRPFSINSLLKAKSEASRIRSEQVIEEPKPLNKEVIPGDILKVYNEISIDKKVEAKAKFDAMQNAVNLVMQCKSDPIPIIKLENVIPRNLIDIASSVSIRTHRTPLIVFTELENKKELFGIGIDRDKDGLLEAAANDYVLSAKPHENSDFSMYLVNRNAFDSFAEETNRRFESQNEKALETTEDIQEEKEVIPSLEEFSFETDRDMEMDHEADLSLDP